MLLFISMAKFKTPPMSDEEWRKVSAGVKSKVKKVRGHLTMEKVRKIYRQEVRKVK